MKKQKQGATGGPRTDRTGTRAKKPAPKPLTKEVRRLLSDLNQALALPEVPGISGTREPKFSTYRPEVKVRPSPLAYIPQDRTKFCECEYDLGEAARALDTEALVARSIIKHFTLCTKEGWTLTGKNPESIDYVRRRLFEFELATLIPFESLVREVLWNLVLFSNAFLVYRRDERYSSGKSITKFEKDLEPIAGVFCADPSSMQIRRNRWGEVKRYYQKIEGDKYTSFSEKYFDPEDILHFHYARKTGLAWGTPYVVPVLDDIRLLRNLEELVNLICHKGAFPLYHYQVGTEQLPCIDHEDGTSEVSEVQDQIEKKPVEGVWVTPERHKVMAVDGEAPLRDLSRYLEHFVMRVLAGLNLSTIDIGQGDTANRGTAGHMSKGLQHQCKDFQKVASYTFTQFFDDLLEEGGYDITPETRVSMAFPEIDIEAQQLVNNHALALYQGNAIDEDEMRKQMGKEPLKEEQHERRHLGRVQMPLLELQRQAQASIAAEKAAESSKNSTTSKNRPSNQSGTKAAAGSKKNDQELRDLILWSVGQVLDEAEALFSKEFPEDRAPMIRSVVEELEARLEGSFGQDAHRARELLMLRATPLYAATKDTLSIFLAPLREAFSAVLLDFLLRDPNPGVVEPDTQAGLEAIEAEKRSVYTDLKASIDELSKKVSAIGKAA